MPNTTKNTVSKCIMARIMRGGEKHQANFTLREYKTYKAAQVAADKWVTKMKKKLPSVDEGKNRMTKRNSSGVVGVWARLADETTNPYCRWYAKWPGCPNAGGVSFSADMMGDDDAFMCAYLARKHETVDRELIFKKLKQVKKTKAYDKAIALKQVDFVGV